MTLDPVTVDLKTRCEHRLEESEIKDQFLICVTATAQASYVDDIRIDLYLTDHPLRTVSGKAFIFYPLNSGETYRFDFKSGDILAVVVRYTTKEHSSRWLVAASGIWMATGHYFTSGARLKDFI